MRRMLDPTKVGGLPSTIEFDKDGNREAKKNLGVDGKLTLKSLVSASNPDGDITKELGGGDKLYRHRISVKGLYAIKAGVSLNYYSYKKEAYTIETFGQNIREKGVSVTGYFVKENKYYLATLLSNSTGKFSLFGYNLTDGSDATLYIDGNCQLFDTNPQPVQ